MHPRQLLLTLSSTRLNKNWPDFRKVSDIFLGTKYTPFKCRYCCSYGCFTTVRMGRKNKGMFYHSPKIPDWQIDNPLRRAFDFYAYSTLFFLNYFILILLVIHFLIDVIHCKLCRKPSVRLYVIIIIIFSWYQSREMYDRTSSPIIVKTEQYLLLLHIIFYYIDTSVFTWK